jgi:hypothetical protein
MAGHCAPQVNTLHCVTVISVTLSCNVQQLHLISIKGNGTFCPTTVTKDCTWFSNLTGFTVLVARQQMRYVLIHSTAALYCCYSITLCTHTIRSSTAVGASLLEAVAGIVQTLSVTARDVNSNSQWVSS